MRGKIAHWKGKGEDLSVRRFEFEELSGNYSITRKGKRVKGRCN